MALQVALSQLRHSKETNVKKNDENQRVSVIFVTILYLLSPIFTEGVLYLDN